MLRAVITGFDDKNAGRNPFQGGMGFFTRRRSSLEK